MKKIILSSACIVILSVFFTPVKMCGQGLTATDYKKALWMTARMYGGQRSGNGPNWLTMDHTPIDADLTNLKNNKGAIPSQFVKGKDFTKDVEVTASGTNSLEGGWVDCGDHVKFGQTYFYAAYTVLKGYAEFMAGYDDHYTGNYSDYSATGDFSWEGGKGKPNGIPDVLEEVKYQCDFLIKCIPDASTFYSQVGNGDLDHQNWVTSPVMAILPKSQGGQNDGPRAYVKNAADASMSSICASTLALMSRVYAKFDPAYAATCLSHAKFAYTYAKNHHGTVPDGQGGSYYGANKHWEDDYASACAELYWATGDASYKTEALSYSSKIINHNWCYNYNNNDDVAAYNLAKLGDASMRTLLQTFVTTYTKAVSGGIYSGGDTGWGSLRYPANAAFVVALWGALNNSTTVDQFIYNQIDFILGKNNSNFSFVVGYTRVGCTNCNYAKHPHHRNVYLINDITANQNNMSIPSHNTQQGYLIGGSRSVPFTESATDYKTSEGGIDYNAGLVGAIGYIISRMAPVDTNRFGHPSPNLGSSQSMCGVSSVLLDSKVPVDNVKTYTWKKDGTTVVNASTSAKTYSATSAGVYTCVLDSAGKWSTIGSVTITATLPDFNIGADQVLCAQTSDTLNAPTGTGYSYTWKKNGNIISGATSNTLYVYTSGTYICTVSAATCAAKSDTIIITSNLPNVVNDTICSAGKAELSVSTAGTYAWYSTPTGGTALATGTSYSANITSSSVYYVQDASSVSGTAGPTSLTSTATSNWGVSKDLQLAFTVGSSFTVNSIKAPINSIYGSGTGTITVEILNGDGTAFSTAKTFTSNSVTLSTSMAGTLVEFPFTNFNIDKSWGTSLRIRLSSVNINGALGFNESGAAYPYNSTPSGVVTFTGAYNGNESKPNWYLYFYNWKISAGSTCNRAPVFAVIDPLGNCGGDTQAPSVPGSISFSSTTTSGMTASWSASTDNTGVTGYEVYVNGTLNSTVTTNSITLTGLNCNTSYAVKVRAKDAVGNYSNFNTEATNTTTTVSSPTIVSPVNYILNASASALSATGTNLKWYTTATGGPATTTAPVPSTSVAGTTTYYVSQSTGTCESSRAMIVVNVSNNQSPTITITAPSNETVYSAPASINITATASDADDTIKDVKFYNGANLLYTDTSYPFAYTWTQVATGTYSITAVASDNNSATTTSTAITVIVNTTQSISLKSGWNLISINVVPFKNDISFIFESLGSNLLTVKDANGFYDPSQTAFKNSLSTIELGKGYLVKVATATTLSVIGLPAPATSIKLKSGWNLIGYPKQSAGTITNSLSGIWTQFVQLKDFNSFYIKNGAMNSLNNMSPNAGYFIKVNADCTLNY